MKVGSTMFQPFGYSNNNNNNNSNLMMTEDIDEDEELLIEQNETPTNNYNNNSSSSIRKAEIRKSNKPIMEKRRRARINNCLNDLKGILLEAMKKDPARHSKLEKADILELTVRHLQNVQRNQLAMAMATDPTVLHRFKNGFAECLTEMNRYMGKLDGVDQGIRQRLIGHLSACVNGLQQVTPPVPAFGGLPPPGPTQLPQPPTHYSPIIIGSSNPNNTFVPQQQQQQQLLHSHPTVIKPEQIKMSNTQQPISQLQQQQQQPSTISQDMNNNTNNNRHGLLMTSENETTLQSHSLIKTVPSLTRHFSSAFTSVANSISGTNKRSVIQNTCPTPPPPNQPSQPSSLLLISPHTSSSSSSDSSSDDISTNCNTSSSLINTSITSGSDISICTGSEKGTNTSPNSFALAAAARTITSTTILKTSRDSSAIRSSPIDFSLKCKEKSNSVSAVTAGAVRVLKVEPMMMMMMLDSNNGNNNVSAERQDHHPNSNNNSNNGNNSIARNTTTILSAKDVMWRPW